MKDEVTKPSSGWDEIIADFKAARFYLWGKRHCTDWYRDEKRGYYHLWKAYYCAIAAKQKQPLWYARILYMMAAEHRYKEGNYEILNWYLIPCIEAYEDAKQKGYKVGDKEFQAAKYFYDSYAYEAHCKSDSEEVIREKYSLIEGFDKCREFDFHDSVVTHFEHDLTTAKMTLRYDKTVVTMIFEDLLDVVVNNCDPEINWISDFYCYHGFRSKELIIFDITHYKITCRRIRIVNYETLS